MAVRRLDYSTPPFLYPTHHTIVVYEPHAAEQKKWINFAWAGVVTGATIVNEYGTLISLHDHDNATTDYLNTGDGNTNGEIIISRMVGARYAAIMENLSSDLGTHVETVYETFRKEKLEFMMGSFLNLYVPHDPEHSTSVANAGVITLSDKPLAPVDFANTEYVEGYYRRPRTIGGSVFPAIVTGNAVYDGVGDPADEGGFVAYYTNNQLKTLDLQWSELLNHLSTGNIPFHQVGVDFKNENQITVRYGGRYTKAGVYPYEHTGVMNFDWSSELFGPVHSKSIFIEQFENGWNSWDYYVDDSAQASAYIMEQSINDNALTTYIGDTGTAQWHVHAKKQGLNIEHGKTYRVRLKARTEAQHHRSISVNIGNANTYETYGSEIFVIDENFNEYSFMFTMPYPTDSNGEFLVDMGNFESDHIPCDVVVDDIVVELIEY